MIGTRVNLDKFGYLPSDLPNGSYGKATARLFKDSSPLKWWNICAPDGSECALNPEIHTVTEHCDGTITVFPSIITKTWHGWLINGEFS